VEFLGVGTGDGQVTGDGILVHINQATGGSRPTAFLDVLQDGQCFVVGQSGVLQDGPFSLGEETLAGTAVDQADPMILSAPASKGEISVAPDTGIRALGILTTQVFDGYHSGHPCL
jgi:hypothetical protein